MTPTALHALSNLPSVVCAGAVRPISGVRATGVAWRPPTGSKALPLMSLVRAAVSSLARPNAQRQIDLDVQPDHACLRPPVQPEPIAHALLNLLSNACRYSSTESRIRVRSSLQWADGAQHVVLTVCDRGIGMSRSHQQRAFEPYWQAPGVNAGPGRGLGLSVARELTDAQGGWLELRSALGIGTEVDLWLPMPLSADRSA
jgi:signal transduction histidine kinase